jgi:hypothetical protein
VNEFWREARLKLFSYAVAALSNKEKLGNSLFNTTRSDTRKNASISTSRYRNYFEKPPRRGVVVKC